MNTFAERLRYVRELRRLSQKDLALAARVSQGAISNYENLTRKIPRSVFKLASVLQVNAQWLVEGSGPMEPLPLVLTLSDHSALPATEQAHHLHWPFSRIMPSVWHTLSTEQQQAIEDMIEAMARRGRQTGVK